MQEFEVNYTKKYGQMIPNFFLIVSVIQLVWLTGYRAQPSNSLQQPCNKKDTHLNICKSTSL